MSLKSRTDIKIVIQPYDGLHYSNENKWRATIWMNLIKIMLTEGSHIQKIIHSTVPLTSDAKPGEQIDSIRRYSSFQWEV